MNWKRMSTWIKKEIIDLMNSENCQRNEKEYISPVGRFYLEPSPIIKMDFTFSVQNVAKKCNIIGHRHSKYMGALVQGKLCFSSQGDTKQGLDLEIAELEGELAAVEQQVSRLMIQIEEKMPLYKQVNQLVRVLDF